MSVTFDQKPYVFILIRFIGDFDAVMLMLLIEPALNVSPSMITVARLKYSGFGEIEIVDFEEQIMPLVNER